MSTEKARDLKIQVAEGIKTLEASVTVIKTADNVAKIKIGDYLEQKINTAIPLTPELIEVMAKKVKNLLDKQSDAVVASGDSQFKQFVAQGVEPGRIIAVTTDSAISININYLAGQQNKPIIINNFKNININQENKSTVTEENMKNYTFFNLKEKFENHYLIFGISLIIAGFITGFIVRGYLVEGTKLIPGLSKQSDPKIAEQINTLINKHNERKSSLHKRYLEYETEATDLGHIENNQQKYSDAAKRIKDLIKQEDEALEKQISKLMGNIEKP